MCNATYFLIANLYCVAYKYVLCLVGTAFFICRENCRHAVTLVL